SFVARMIFVYVSPRYYMLHSFPTRRSSDLTTVGDFVTFVFDPPFTVLEGDKMTMDIVADINGGAASNIKMHFEETSDIFAVGSLDRKSTRLNSSHRTTSYAVFCLKKKI